MPGPRLIAPTTSLLLVIDVQSRLVPAIHEGESLVDSCAWTMDVAIDLDIPMLMTEQYPEGLGETVASLRERVSADRVFSKTHFSCVYEPGFLERINDTGRNQMVMIGMEAHVCVMQTVLTLLDADYDVFVVADSIGSRNPSDREFAIERMRQAGATMVTREMLFFEWLQRAGDARFSSRLRQHITGETGLDKRRGGY